MLLLFHSVWDEKEGSHCVKIFFLHRRQNMNWKNTFETSPLTSSKNEYKSNDIIVKEKHTGTRKYSQITRTNPVAEIVTTFFSTFLFNFFQSLLYTVIQHPGFTTEEAAIQFWLRNSRFAGTAVETVAQKGKKARQILQCPLISMVCCLPTVNPSRM